jgi:hypothetical protein
MFNVHCNCCWLRAHAATDLLLNFGMRQRSAVRACAATRAGK